MKSFSTNKNNKLKEIQETFQKRVEDKMKKVYESTDIIKKIELKKYKERENKKIDQFEGIYYNLQKIKQNFDEKKSKEKKKNLEVKENLQDLAEEQNIKSTDLSNKINQRQLRKINNFLTKRMDDFYLKRQNSVDRCLENHEIIIEINKSKNYGLLNSQKIKHERSYEKTRSLNVSKENIR